MITSEKQWHPVHSCNDGIFNSASGEQVSILHPAAATIKLRDIASGLAKTCRFGGQTTHFYSVAQHSVLVAHLAPPYLRAHALLHDASEAYLGDVIKPLKVIIGRAYSELEETFMCVIRTKYALLRNEMEQLKPFDKLACQLEHEAFQKGDIMGWGEFWKKNELGDVNVWSPDYGYKAYMEALGEVFSEEDCNE
jgi:hypothetical protein